MKTLVVYDSAYGNTEIIARAIGDAIPGDVCVTKVSEADASDLKSLNLLIIGSPVYAGRATQPIQAFMRSIPDGSIRLRKYSRIRYPYIRLVCQTIRARRTQNVAYPESQEW